MSDVREDDVRSRGLAPLVVAYGAGVNSLAGLIILRRREISPDLVLFADTGGAKSDGGEKPETYGYIEEHFRPWLRGAFGLELTRVYNASPRAGHISLEADCLAKETMPSRAFGLSSCAMRWKIEPQDKFVATWAPAVAARASGAKPIRMIGYDGGEERRANIHEDEKFRYWYPLIEWGLDRDACEALIRSERLPVPPKSACFYCPSSTKTEVLQLAKLRPNYFRRALAIESTALQSQRHNLRTIKGLGRHWSWAELAAASDTERAALPEAPVEACVTCNDDGCAP